MGNESMSVDRMPKTVQASRHSTIEYSGLHRMKDGTESGEIAMSLGNEAPPGRQIPQENAPRLSKAQLAQNFHRRIKSIAKERQRLEPTDPAEHGEYVKE